jgi:hypothetical protein
MSEDRYDDGYTDGEAAAMRGILGEVLKHLNPGERDKHAWVLERSAAIAALREVCRELDDNDWPDDLHLADIINNYVLPHLQD